MSSVATIDARKLVVGETMAPGGCFLLCDDRNCKRLRGMKIWCYNETTRKDFNWKTVIDLFTRCIA